MCEFASFVLTKDRVFWSDNSSSHDDTIKEHNLHEAGEGQRINIVRVEISPDKSWTDIASWKYKVDQDLLPDWHSAEETERRTREALSKRFEKKPWPKIFKQIDAFLKSLSSFHWFKPDGKPLKSWKLFEAPTWDAARGAAWGAARDAARGAAWGAARDAAWGATWDAARDAALGAARGAARDAALGAALGAARDAVRDAARDAAWGATSDAGLYVVTTIMCAGTNLDPKLIKHAKDRWRVWQKGYGLMCDVDGVLYVYG